MRTTPAITRLAAAGSAALMAAAALTVTAGPAAALAQTQATVASVNGVAGGSAAAGTVTEVTFRFVNTSTARESLTSIGLVVPKAARAVMRGTASSPGGAWTETVLSCGTRLNCSAVVLLTPSRTSAVAKPGQAVTASLSFTAPDTAQTLTFPVISINGRSVLLSSPAPTVNVVSDAVVLPGTPGTPISGRLQLTTGFVDVYFSNGAFGPVTLSSEPVPCPTGQIAPNGCVTVTIDGVFTDPQNPDVHLYTNQSPASIYVGCAATVCPYVALDHGQQVDDYLSYPINVSLKVNGQYQPFGLAPPCRELYNADQSGLTGEIVAPDAVAAGYCVDVYGIYREGDLVRPVLFVEDPRLTPISR